MQTFTHHVTQMIILLPFPVSFISFTCPLSVASMSTAKVPLLTQAITVVLCASVCLRSFSFLVQAVGNIRLKYSHSTSHVWLTQHVSPGWKGCVLPEGTQAACQIRLWTLVTAFVMADTRDLWTQHSETSAWFCLYTRLCTYYLVWDFIIIQNILF